MDFFKAFALARIIIKADNAKNKLKQKLASSKFDLSTYGSPISQINTTEEIDTKSLSKDEKLKQIKEICKKCGSDAKTAARNRDTGKVMIACLKCNDWVDFRT